MEIKNYIIKNDLTENDASDIADFIWWTDNTLIVAEKLSLTLKLFNLEPTYGVLSQLSRNFDKLNDVQKEKLWEQYKVNLSSGKTKHREITEYSLWVDFFENSETVHEAWRKMIGEYSDENILKRLLTISGPVPFDLKDELYLKVFRNKNCHEYILDSLVGSFFDVFGEINFQRTRILLPTLDVNKKSEKYLMLNASLKKFDSKIEYWESINKKKLKTITINLQQQDNQSI